jgi:membrane-bound hydrogenase subunit alpha
VFHFVKTDGSNSPVRHKVRAPSYVNIPTFKTACVGQSISDAAIALAAVDPCYCCTERLVTVYDRKSRDRIMGGEALLTLSRCRTEQFLSRNQV